MKHHVRRILNKITALLLSCLMMYGSFVVCVFAQGGGNKPISPPDYMRALSELVRSTRDENDFGSIVLEVGSTEMTVDGSARQISPDESRMPIIEGGEVLIPKEALNIDSDNAAKGGTDNAAKSGTESAAKGGTESAAEVPESDDALLTADELEARGYEVTCDSSSGTILITEPFQSMRLIVKTKNGNLKDTYGASQKIKVSNNKTVLQYQSKEAAKNANEQLNADPSVLFCAQDSLVSIQDTKTDETRVYKSWGTTRVGADEYMGTLPDASALAEVVVAVIDTGVDLDHPFLSGRIKAGGWDFYNNDDDPDDDHSHGTHCAGIIADATKSNVKILPVKVMNAEGCGPTSVVVEGMMYAVDSGADILSMSFGALGSKVEENEPAFLFYQDIIEYASTKNVSCVAAAGNNHVYIGTGSSYYALPAELPDVIAVTSSNEKDKSSTFSNYGSAIDICAPGENILSAVPGGKFDVKSGTSMSTPLVAACAALLKTMDPSMTPGVVCAALCERANDRGMPGRDDYFGAGLVYVGAYKATQQMSFEASAVTLDTYESIYDYLNFYPEFPSDNTVTYFSSDESVAYVDTLGGIVGLKAGIAAITAVSTQGGFTDTVTVTVKGKGNSSSTFSKVTANDNSVLFLKNNKTAYAYGIGYNNVCGYYTRSSDYTYLFPFCEDPKTMITDIEDISANSQFTLFTRTDKTLWIVGKLSDVTYRKPVQVMMEAGTPLTDIVKVRKNRAYRDDGTVWLVLGTNDYAELMAYEADAVDGYAGALYGNSSYNVTLKSDGTVWVKGSNKFNNLGTPEVESSEEFIQVKTSKDTYLTDVMQIAYNGFGTYALCEDGTVWSWGGWYESISNPLVPESGWLGIGPYNNEKIYATQVKIDANTPLTHVLQLGEMTYGARMIFILDDGSIWWTGKKRLINPDTDECDCALYAEPFVIVNNRQVYIGRDDTAESYVSCHVTSMQLDKTVMSVKKGDSFTLNASVLPLDAENQNICWVSDNPEVAWVAGDGTVTAKGVGTAVIRAMSYEDRGIFAECHVAVEGESPTKISLKKLPDKLTYLTGETLDTSGGVLYLTYANGQVKSLPLAASFCSGYDLNTAGNQHVTVTYAGLSAFYDITVNHTPTVTSVEIKQPPAKTEYIKGEKLDTKGGVLTVQYSDGTSKEVDITSGMCAGYDPQTPGSQTVTVSFSGKSCTYAVSVRDPAVTGIVIVSAPEKAVYNAFDALMIDGGTIAQRYENSKFGTNIPITADMCSGYDMSKIGPQTVTVTYGGHSTSFTIEVYNTGDAAYIAMHTLPNQLYYHYYDNMPLDLTGGSIMVHYKDGSTEIVDLNECTYSKIKTSGGTPDPQIVTVTYYGMTTTFEIRSIRKLDTKDLIGIKVTRLPDKLEYRIHASIDTAGGKVQLEFQDNLLIEDDMYSYVKSGYNSKTPGQSEITVEYGGKSDSFFVNYVDAEAEKIIDEVYWGKTPRKTVYYLGDDLDVLGSYVYITFHFPKGSGNRSTDYAYLTEDMCSGYDLTKTGEQTVTVTYEGFTLTFKIWVSDLILENELPTINIGKSTRVAAYFSPKSGTLKTLSWSSSNPTVATVDKYGLVRGVSEGSAVITAKVAGAVLSSSCTVTVTENDISVTGVDILFTSSILDVGDEEQLPVNVKPANAADKSLTWSSSDEDVATVDEDGLVTAVGTGTATVTVKTNDGGYTAACTVTVTGSLDIRVTGISLNKNKLTISYKATERLTADVQPDNASDKSVVWSSSNSGVAAVDQNGVVTGVSRGTATITARTADGDFAAVCQVEVKFQWWQWLLWILMLGFLWY